MTRTASSVADLSGKIARWVAERTEEMASVIQELVAIPNANPPGQNYGICADVLERHLRNAGLLCERFEWNGAGSRAHDSVCCLTGTSGAGARALYFHGHYDVVPAQSDEQFTPRRDKSFIFGRGSCDMKGGIVSMLFAARALKECGVKLGGRVVLTFVPDEETGGARGSAWLANSGLLGRGGVGMLTAEPTSGVVWNGNRGAITLRVDVLGKSAHVGLQHQGENAFEAMHEIVSRLLELKREVEQRTTGLPVAGISSGDDHGEGKRGPRNSILLIGGESGGGTNFNVVPDRAWFTVDRRINPEEDFTREKETLLGVLSACKRDGIRLECSVLQEGRASNADPHQPLGRALAKAIQQVTAEDARFEMCPGLLENRFYAAQGIPAFAYGPGLLSVAHGPNEYVDLRRVADCAVIYALTAAETLRA
jgi:acetylornithine deacetylase/succinyl-diaminopimelate desuccinylase family protein